MKIILALLDERILKVQENKKNVLSEGITSITAKTNLKSTRFHCASSKHSKQTF